MNPDNKRSDSELQEIDANKRLKENREKLIKEANWDDLLPRDKLRLLDMWSILVMMANIC